MINLSEIYPLVLAEGPTGATGSTGAASSVTGPTGPSVAYASGNKIIQRWPIHVFSANGISTTTSSTAAARSYFYLDLNDTAKWNPTNCSTPTITFFVYGSLSAGTGGALATFLLHNTTTSSTITGSSLSTTNSGLTLLSSTITQASFPSTPTIVELRYWRDGGSGGTVQFSFAYIEAVWTVN